MNPKQAMACNSLVLILIGIIGYFLKSSPTALIPAVFGVLLLLCYFSYDRNNKVIAHIAVVLMVAVFISLFKPLASRLIDSDIYGIMRIALMQLVTFYSIICFIKSFIDARKSNN
tara:strand:- start:599 stop:943 length:345 start_codon:yes stop_codon:yes gene_type:complete